MKLSNTSLLYQSKKLVIMTAETGSSRLVPQSYLVGL
jgi:hypothetical protein